MNISVAIMAHPQREPWVHELRALLDYESETVWDKVGNVWDTGKRAWEAHDPSSDWHLVIQDDAIPVPGLMEHLPHILRNRTTPVGLYLGRIRPYEERLKRPLMQLSGSEHIRWIKLNRIYWGVAVAIPTPLIQPAITHHAQDSAYDIRLARYFEAQRIPTYYTWPSLVQHRLGPSLLRHHTGDRQAYWVANPADYDWHDGTREINLDRSR